MVRQKKIKEWNIAIDQLINDNKLDFLIIQYRMGVPKLILILTPYLIDNIMALLPPV